MKNAIWAILALLAISLVGCGKSENKVTVTKSADGTETTTVTTPDGRVLSRTSK